MHLKNNRLKDLVILCLLLLMACSVAFYGIKKVATENIDTIYTDINIELGHHIYKSLYKQISQISKTGEFDLLEMQEANGAIEDWLLKLDRVLLAHSEIQPSSISMAYRSEAIKIWRYYWNNKELLKITNEDKYKTIFDKVRAIDEVRKDGNLDKWMIKKVYFTPVPI